jgi:ABC-type glycerol-3-phosphate transport system permease component
MIITSLKSHAELTTRMVPRFFISIKEMHWENYKIVFGPTFSFGKYILNTLFVGIMTMIFTVITTILAAFAFSRLKFPGRDLIFMVLLGTMMIPGELYTITNFVTVSHMGWMNTFYALIVPFSTSVFYIFFLRQSFLQIPETLYQSAKVDGCSDMKYLTRVMLPIAQPTLITVVILSTIGAWDAYIWPRLVTNKDHWLISVALRSTSFTTGEGSDARPMYNLQLAATAIVTIPLMIIFFAFKKYIIKGVGRSGTKG